MIRAERIRLLLASTLARSRAVMEQTAPVYPSKVGELVVNGDEVWTRLGNNELQKALSGPPRPGVTTPDGWTIKWKMADQTGSWLCAKPSAVKESESVPKNVRGIVSRRILNDFAEAVETVLLCYEQKAHEEGKTLGTIPNDTLVKDAIELMGGVTVTKDGNIYIFAVGTEEATS